MKNKTRNASQPLGSNSNSGGSNSSKPPSKRIYHYLALVFLIGSSFFELNWLWGLLFIGWTIPAVFNGSIFFIDMIEREKEPVFFWSIFVVWIGFGVLMVLQDWEMLASWFS